MEYLPPKGIEPTNITRIWNKKSLGLFASPINLKEYLFISHDLLSLLDKTYGSGANDITLNVLANFNGGTWIHSLKDLNELSNQYSSAPLSYFESNYKASDGAFELANSCRPSISKKGTLAKPSFDTNVLQIYTIAKPMTPDQYNRFQKFSQALMQYTPRKI